MGEPRAMVDVSARTADYSAADFGIFPFIRFWALLQRQLSVCREGAQHGPRRWQDLPVVRHFLCIPDDFPHHQLLGESDRPGYRNSRLLRRTLLVQPGCFGGGRATKEL